MSILHFQSNRADVTQGNSFNFWDAAPVQGLEKKCWPTVRLSDRLPCIRDHSTKYCAFIEIVIEHDFYRIRILLLFLFVYLTNIPSKDTQPPSWWCIVLYIFGCNAVATICPLLAACSYFRFVIRRNIFLPSFFFQVTRRFSLSLFCSQVKIGISSVAFFFREENESDLGFHRHRHR